MSLRYDAELNDVAPKTPILSSIFTFAGWTEIAVAVVLGFVGWRTYQETQNASALSAIAIIDGCLIFGALVSFGVAQLLNYFAIMAHHAANEKAEAILQSLHKIEAHLEAMRRERV